MTQPESTAPRGTRVDSTPAPVGDRHTVGRLTTLLVFAVLLGLYAFQLWFHATRTSSTNDEAYHILAGHRYLRCGDYGINPEHPPLLKLLAALPINSYDLAEPSWPCGSKATEKYDGFLAGAQFLSRNGVDRILIPTRLAASLMSLLLAALLFLAAWEMFGKAEAFVALALLAFEPTLVAHGSLVATDMALTATFFAATYALYRYRRKPGAARLLVAGLAVGLMLASKHTGLVMLPVLFLLLLVDVLLGRRTEAGGTRNVGRNLLRQAGAYVLIFLMGMAVLWATYGFRYYALPGVSERSLPIGGLAQSRPGLANSLPGYVLGAFYYSRIFPEAYTYGLADVLRESQRPTYFFGQMYEGGLWYYFPVAFSIKTSIPLLVLLLLALLTPGLYRRRPREMLFLLLPSAAFFAVTMTSGFNIGVRHVLPVYPFLIAVAAAGAGAWARKSRAFTYVLVALLLFHAVTAARTAPAYIPFANDLWGGTNNTYRLLHDSNVDWGQNLKLAGEYVKREGAGDCWYAYVGPGELGRVNQTCRLMPALDWRLSDELVDPIPPVIEGTVLISAEALHPPFGPIYDSFTKTKPVEMLGGSVFVYRGRFEVPLVASVSHIGRALQCLRLRRSEEALAEARRAVEFAPEHPPAHLVVAFSYLSLGRNDEARQELETTLRLAETNPALYRVEVAEARRALDRLSKGPPK